jgi:hypothetical protein
LSLLPHSVIISQIIERERFIQMSGIVTDEESKPVSNVSIISIKLRRGTISEKSGIYSIISIPGDTILFRSLGYKKTHVIIPSSFESRNFTFDIVLYPDTIPIADVIILPWKTYAEFIKAMTEEHPEKPEIKNMYENIESIYISLANTSGVKISPEAGYRYAMQQNANMLITRNQYPVNNLLNPFAWSKFFNGVKNGLFKNQKFNKPLKAKTKIKKKKAASD